MLTVSDVIEIYALQGIELSENHAREDIAHVQSFNVGYDKAVRYIEGYAQQEAFERQGDAHESRWLELERN